MTTPAPQKPVLGWDQLSGLALVAKQIDQLPDSPEKEAMKARYADAHNQLLEKYDMPIREESARQAALGLGVHVADYGSGLLRTASGETVLAAKAAADKARGAPSSWTPEGAEARMKQAVNPLAPPALSNARYMEMAGVPEMGRLEDPHGNFPTVTGRGALGFGLDTVENPATLMGGIRAILAGGAHEVAPPVMAATMRAEESAAKDAAQAAPSPGFLESAKGVPGKTASTIADPLSNLRDALLAIRFKNADEAARMGGKPLPSKIFQEEGAKGITSNQLRQDARAIVNANSEKIQKITDTMNQVNPSSIMRGTPDMAAEPQFADPKSAMYPLYTPEQAALERTPFTAKDAQAARAQIEDEYRIAAAGNPGIQKLLKERLEGAGAGAGATAMLDGQQMPLFDVPPTQVVRSRPEITTYTPDGFIGGTRPAKEIIAFEGGSPSINAANPSMDPLSLDEPLSLSQVSRMAGAAQGKAATRKFYLARDRFAPDSPQTPPASREALAAEGGLYAQQGGHLRGLQEDLMDEAAPGSGGDVHAINRKSSALLEGMPYIDRPKPTPSSGRPTSRSKSAFGGPWQTAVDLAGDSGKGASMAGYQALSNPYLRQGALPAARAYGLREYWQDRMTPTVDENARPGGDNPWALIYKYGAQQ